MSNVIWWLRRDLRLEEHPILEQASRRGEHLLPVFILDPVLLQRCGKARRNFLVAGLAGLDRRIRELGGRLIIRHGDPTRVLTELTDEVQAQGIRAIADDSPYSRRRDAAVKSVLPLELVAAQSHHPPELILNRQGQPFTRFAAFRAAWLALPGLGRAEGSGKMPVFHSLDLASDLVPDHTQNASWLAGSEEAIRRLAAFLQEDLQDYGSRRDRLDESCFSQLSPYFRFGMLSIRRVVGSVRSLLEEVPAAARTSAQKWLDELIWGEYFRYLLHHFPDRFHQAFQERWRSAPWWEEESAWQAWTNGETGYPIVDAAMRQLLAEGWLPNRARMVAASFLVKDLLIYWRRGERWFRQHLLDGDLAPNAGNWQWVAGCGADPAPWFRVFNPILQGQRFDPRGAYVRRWLPELANIADRCVHSPWLMTPEEQDRAGCRIGREYPGPIVDHAWARSEYLASIKKFIGTKGIEQSGEEL